MKTMLTELECFQSNVICHMSQTRITRRLIEILVTFLPAGPALIQVSYVDLCRYTIPVFRHVCTVLWGYLGIVIFDLNVVTPVLPSRILSKTTTTPKGFWVLIGQIYHFLITRDTENQAYHCPHNYFLVELCPLDWLRARGPKSARPGIDYTTQKTMCLCRNIICFKICV